MATAIVSDLHLGSTAGADVARRPEVRERLLEALGPADRVVLLGDTLELRERPVAEALALARPVLEGLGEVTAGRQVVIVPGNHDHELVAPALEAARIEGRPALSSEGAFDVAHSGLASRVAALMPRTEVVLAYPGIRLRPDVYATHGHYLDRHLTVPRMECVLASAVARFAGPQSDRASVADAYEAALAPIYAFAHAIAQGTSGRAATKPGNLSRSVWKRANSDGGGAAALAVRRLAVPGAVRALNAIGLGPFRADISGLELRRAGLRAMGQVVSALGVDADHVIFGHTHRAGPRPGDAEGWWLPQGTRLTNTGSWLYEAIFLEDGGVAQNPYWPGSVTWLGEQGPPEQSNVLGGVDLTEVHAAARI